MKTSTKELLWAGGGLTAIVGLGCLLYSKAAATKAGVTSPAPPQPVSAVTVLPAGTVNVSAPAGTLVEIDLPVGGVWSSLSVTMQGITNAVTTTSPFPPSFTSTVLPGTTGSATAKWIDAELAQQTSIVTLVG